MEDKIKINDIITKMAHDFASIPEPDRERAIRYALDLGRGLKIIRTYPQGVTVYGSARLREDNKYYKAARKLGNLLAQNGHAVITGGGPGIMEAANRGAYEYGGRSIGLNIQLPDEQDTNPYLTDTMEFRYFFSRRVMLTMSSKTYAFFPGGYGTMDELTEALVLMQEGKMPRMPVFLYGKSYWRGLDRFITKMMREKLINYGDTKIFKVTDDINEIVRAAEKAGHLKVGENIYDRANKVM
ncbi:TIGR00730 family Rossman fold protein [Candidatus Saccharibacteria bacterium]|nr:TIGR00730 family Rossman fold protein [Candidatus Saccharibacteria bacterium]